MLLSPSLIKLSGLEFVGDTQISFQWWTQLREEAQWRKCAFVYTIAFFRLWFVAPFQNMW